MKNTLIRQIITVGIITILWVLPFTIINAQKTELDRTPPILPDFNLNTRGERGEPMLEKLAPELRTLYKQFAPTRGEKSGADESGLEGFTASQLSEFFGIDNKDQNPTTTISVKFVKTIDSLALKNAGANVFSKSSKTVVAFIPVQNLLKLATSASVQSITVFKSLQIPAKPVESRLPEVVAPIRGGRGDTPTPLANEFNKQGMTGKGVIVGVIDSGIDWRHKDFIRPDGTSRILAIWDLYDNSYQTSSGAVGSQPPVQYSDTKAWFGTVYTNAQINAALKGTGKINTADKYGHGSAVAGTAAGNGRATKDGVPSPALAGVAPDADLIIVKGMDCGGFHPYAEMTSEWMTNYAKAVKKPIVINMSFGGQFSTHDGMTDGEKFIDEISGAGKPGVAVTVSAGNDGGFNLHSTGRFGAKRPGQADNLSAGIDLKVKQPSLLLGVFSTKDTWGFAFRSNLDMFSSTDGKQMPIFIFKTLAGSLDYATNGTPKYPDQLKTFISSIQLKTGDNINTTADTVSMQLPAGDYLVWSYGTSANVTEGKFDFYLPGGAFKAFFGDGVAKNGVVGSPGNANNAITVGSYDFRTTWDNITGQTTFYNLQTGAISDYSSMGFRRDGVVKPEIAAPARYTLSPLSEFAKKANGGCDGSMANDKDLNFTADGFHLAWSGTSAASPFTAGVVALMLQKNPNLDAAQIKQILQKTARTGGLVGSVPNAAWGYGMINPAAALTATPAATTTMRGGKSTSTRGGKPTKN